MINRLSKQLKVLIVNGINHLNIISFSFWLLYFRSCIPHSCGYSYTIRTKCIQLIDRQSKWNWIEVEAVNNHQMSPFKKEVFKWNQIVSIGISFLKLIAFPFLFSIAHQWIMNKMVNWTQNTVDPDEGDGFSFVKRFAFIMVTENEKRIAIQWFFIKNWIRFRCGHNFKRYRNGNYIYEQ